MNAARYILIALIWIATLAAGSVSALAPTNTGMDGLPPDVVPPGNQEVCEGEEVTLEVQANPNGAVIEWYTVDGQDTLTYVDGVAFTPHTTGLITYTLVASDGIVSDTSTVEVNVVELHTISSAADRTLCINSTMTPIEIVFGGGATNATVQGLLPGGISSAVSNETLTISGTATTAGTFNYTAQTVANACPSVQTSGTITVLPENTFDLSSAPESLDQEICEGDSIDPITFETSGAGGVNFNNLPQGLSAIWDDDLGSITGFPTDTGVFSFEIELTGGCGDVSQGVELSVRPRPVVDAGPDQLLCDDDPVVELEGTVINAPNHIWSSPDDEGAFQNVSQLATLFEPSEDQLDSGSVVLTLTAQGGAAVCGIVSDSLTLTFTEAFSAFFEYDDPFCSNQDELVSPELFGTEGGVYGGDIPGIDPQDGSFNPSDLQSGEYDVTYTVPEGGGCAQFDTTLSITINHPLSEVQILGNDSEFYCNQEDLILTGTAQNALSFQWEIEEGGGDYIPLPDTTIAYTPQDYAGEVLVSFSASALPGCFEIVTVFTDFVMVPPHGGEIQEVIPEVCEGDLLTFAAEETEFDQYYTYEWNLQDENGNPTGSATGPEDEAEVTYQLGSFEEESSLEVSLSTMVDGSCLSQGSENFEVFLEPDICDYFELAGNILVINACEEGEIDHFYQWGCGSNSLEDETDIYLHYGPYLDECEDFWVSVSLYEDGRCPVYEGSNFPVSASASPEWQMQVYPNPASRELFLELPAAALSPAMTYELYSQSGVRISQGNLQGMAYRQIIDIGKHAAGYYILQVRSGEHIFRHSIAIIR